MTMHYGAGPVTFARAQQLRKSETRAEKLLWEKLSNKQLGVKFRRQHPLNHFIADFYCHSLKLVIEVDGSIHSLEENREWDQLRTSLIEEFGIRLIRFSNDDIYFRLGNVIETIKCIIAENK